MFGLGVAPGRFGDAVLTVWRLGVRGWRVRKCVPQMPATCGVAGCDLLGPIAVAGRVNPAVNRAVVQVLTGLPTPPGRRQC